MQIYAHRGMHGTAPENTMAAFLRAEMAGLDGIETDLRTTADRRVVLFHDRTFAGRAVVDHTHAELVRATGIDVPLLEDVLDRDWRATWNFEIKTRAAGEMAVDIMRGAVPSGCIVSSFDHYAVRAASDSLEVQGALLLASLPLYDTLLPDPDQLVGTLVWDWNVARPDAFEDAVALGWRNMVYGPVTKSEHDALELLRPWGVITDHPEHLARNNEL